MRVCLLLAGRRAVAFLKTENSVKQKPSRSSARWPFLEMPIVAEVADLGYRPQRFSELQDLPIVADDLWCKLA
jgi:hypothetical protein